MCVIGCVDVCVYDFLSMCLMNILLINLRYVLLASSHLLNQCIYVIYAHLRNIKNSLFLQNYHDFVSMDGL